MKRAEIEEEDAFVLSTRDGTENRKLFTRLE
jgi:hypothetical protein